MKHRHKWINRKLVRLGMEHIKVKFKECVKCHEVKDKKII